MARNVELLDENGEAIYPTTDMNCVYDNDGYTVKNLLDAHDVQIDNLSELLANCSIEIWSAEDRIEELENKTSNYYIDVGEVVDLTPGNFAGTVQGTTALRFTIPLSKPIHPDVKTFNFPGNFSIYGPSGAISSAKTLSSISKDGAAPTVYVRKYGITVYITLATAVSTGNVPVVIYGNGGCTMVASA